MGFLLLCVATIAFGRAPFGAEAMLNSRYRVYSELAAVVTLIAVLWRVGPRQRNLLLILLLPATAFWFWQSWERNLPPLAELITQQRTSQTRYVLTGRGIYRGFPPQDATDSLLKRADDEGYFRRVSPSSFAGTLIESDLLPRQRASLSLWADAPIVDATTITVRGFDHVNDPVVVWFKGDKHLFQGALQTQRIFNPAGADWRIFWNTLPRTGLAPGRYTVGYSSGDASPPVIAWDDDWLELK
jgi:hypothetical protein